MLENLKLTPFPKRTLPAEMKETKEYNIKIGNAILSYFKEGYNPALNLSRVAEMEELEKWATGNHDMKQFKKQFSLTSDKGRFRGLSDLSFEPVMYAPKVVNSITEILNQRGTELNISFTDQTSVEEKRNKKAKIWIESQESDFINKINESAGLQAEQSQFNPSSKEELDLYEKEGGIKLDFEVAYEEALKYVFNFDNQWHKYISPRIKEQLITWSVSGIYTFIDPITRKISFRLINPKNIVIDHSSFYDYRDSKIFGEIITMSLMDVITAVRNTTGERLDEEKIRQFVKTESTNFSNSVTGNYDIGDWYDSPKFTTQTLNCNNVQVLDFVYLSEDIIESPVKNKTRVDIAPHLVTKRELRNGRVMQDSTGYYRMVDESESKPLYIRVWRRGKIVIGSEDIVFDYGLCYDQTKDIDGDPIRPFFVRRLPTESLIKSIIPNIRQIQTAFLKVQSELLRGHGKTLTIDMNALQAVTLGNHKYEPRDLIKVFRLDNVAIWRSNTSGLPGQPNGGLPINELEGGIGVFLSELMAIIDFNIRMIQENTGLNSVALAGNPNPEVTFGQSQIALGGANNAIASIYNAYKDIKEWAAYSTVMFLQKISKEEPDSIYKDMLGKQVWGLIKGVKDMRNVGFKIDEMPTADEMAYTNDAINVALAGGKNGNAGITIYEAIELRKMMKEGKSLSLIALMLKNKIEAREKQAQEYASASLAQQGQQNQELAAQNMKMQERIMELESMLDYRSKSALQKEKIAQQIELKKQTE